MKKLLMLILALTFIAGMTGCAKDSGALPADTTYTPALAISNNLEMESTASPSGLEDYPLDLRDLPQAKTLPGS